MHAHIFYIAMMGFLLSSCGEKEPNSKPIITVDNNSEKIDPAFDIDEGWHVTTKSCGQNVSVPMELESYRFDSLYFVRIQKLFEDETMLCKVGYVYERIISSFESTSTAYIESSILQPTMTKKTCWKKSDGRLTDETITDNNFEFAGTTASLSLTYKPSKMSLVMQNMSECPEESLHLTLNKK